MYDLSSDESDLESTKLNLNKSSEVELGNKVDQLIKYYSAPNTPLKAERSVQPKHKISISELTKSFKAKMALQETLTALNRKRAPHKAYVTKNLKAMQALLAKNELTLNSF